MIHRLIALRLPVVVTVVIVMIVMVENKNENDIKRDLRGKGGSTKGVRRRKILREKRLYHPGESNKYNNDKKLVAALVVQAVVLGSTI
jgi:hypothetical protein